MTYSVKTKDRIYVKTYGLFPFAKNISNKYSQKLLILLKNLQQIQ